MKPKKYSRDDMRLMNTSCKLDTGIVAIATAMMAGNDYNLGEHTLEDLSLYARQTEDHVWTMGLANAASQLGFKVKYYSSQNVKNYNGEISGLSKKKVSPLEELTTSLRNLNAPMLNEILKEMPKGGIPIVLLKEKNDEIYVIVKGYDQDNIIVVNPYSKPRAAIKTLNRNTFTNLWKKAGYETVIIYTGIKPIRKAVKKQEEISKIIKSKRKTNEKSYNKISPLESVDQFFEKLETNAIDRFEEDKPPRSTYVSSKERHKRAKKNMQDKNDA